MSKTSKITPEIGKEIDKMRKNKMSVAKIATALDLPTSSVNYYVYPPKKKAGAKKTPKKAAAVKTIKAPKKAKIVNKRLLCYIGDIPIYINALNVSSVEIDTDALTVTNKSGQNISIQLA